MTHTRKQRPVSSNRYIVPGNTINHDGDRCASDRDTHRHAKNPCKQSHVHKSIETHAHGSVASTVGTPQVNPIGSIRAGLMLRLHVARVLGAP